MSNVAINSHLILTPKQEKELRDIPSSDFIQNKWKSQTDADSFLRKHDLILKDEPERKLKVQYSVKAKSIWLLQCCCGIDPILRRKKRAKNDNSKARKSRQIYKFVGCLAHARIKIFKDNCIDITGYLTHSDDCQRQKPSFVLGNCKKTKNEIKNYEYVKECKTKEVDVENNDEYATKTEECNDIGNDEFVTKINAERFEKEIKAWDVSNNKLRSKDEIEISPNNNNAKCCVTDKEVYLLPNISQY